MSPSAFADTSEGAEVILSAGDLRVWRLAPDNCGRSNYDLSVKNAAWTDWAGYVTIRSPRGQPQRTALLTPDEPANSIKLCSSSPSGVYSVSVDWQAFDESGAMVASESVVTGFRFSVRDKVSTKLKVTLDHVRRGFWTIDGKLTKKGKAFRGAPVVIQAKYLGSWRNLKTKTTNRKGMVRFTSEPKPGAGKYPVRLHYRGDAHYKPSNSTSFRLYP